MDRTTKAEIAFAFSQMYDKDLEVVPEELLRDIATDFDIEKFMSFDKGVPFTSQNLSKEALEVLASIFKNK